MIEALSSSKTSVLTTATWRNIPEDGILKCRTFEVVVARVYLHAAAVPHLNISSYEGAYIILCIVFEDALI
jgi:hypothetical protein